MCDCVSVGNYGSDLCSILLQQNTYSEYLVNERTAQPWIIISIFSRLAHLPPQCRLRAASSSLLSLLKFHRTSLLPLDRFYVLYTSLLLLGYPSFSGLCLFSAYRLPIGSQILVGWRFFVTQSATVAHVEALRNEDCRRYGNTGWLNCINGKRRIWHDRSEKWLSSIKRSSRTRDHACITGLYGVSAKFGSSGSNTRMRGEADWIESKCLFIPFCDIYSQ